MPSLIPFGTMADILGMIPAHRLVQKIELFFQCRALPNMDVMSKSGGWMCLVGVAGFGHVDLPRHFCPHGSLAFTAVVSVVCRPFCGVFSS